MTNWVWMKGCSRRTYINVYEQRAASDNCGDGWRKLVPAFVGIEQPSPFAVNEKQT